MQKPRHCEERSDEAIQGHKEELDCFVAKRLLAMTAVCELLATPGVCLC